MSGRSWLFTKLNRVELHTDDHGVLRFPEISLWQAFEFFGSLIHLQAALFRATGVPLSSQFQKVS